MARIWMFILLLISLSIPALLIDPDQIKAFSSDGSVSGVFQVTFKSVVNTFVYSFNASEAREVCQSLGVTIASKAQVEEAVRHGFETCRFGWIDEQIAVIPRIQPSFSCGQNKTGIVPWRASVSQKFDVFCFDLSAYLEAQLDTTTADLTTKETALSSTPAVGAHLMKSAHSTQSTSQSPPSSTSLFPSLGNPDEEEEHQSMSSAQSSIGAVPTALLIMAVVVLLLTGVAVLWYFKMNRSCLPFWDGEQQKEYIETEEWNHSCVKDQKEPEDPADQKKPQSVSDEDMSRKNSNDVSIAMDPGTGTDS